MSKFRSDVCLIQNMYFKVLTTSEPTKIGLIFSKKVIQKLKLSKNVPNRKLILQLRILQTAKDQMEFQVVRIKTILGWNLLIYKVHIF